MDKEINILIGTINPSKIEGIKTAFLKYYKTIKYESIETKSNISEQPIGEEIIEGAKNRIKHLKNYSKDNNIKVDFYVSIEAGLINIGNKILNTNLCLIEDVFGYESIGMSQCYLIPDFLVEKIKKESLGKVYDQIFKEKNLNQKEGGIHYLSKGYFSRNLLVENSVISALLPFINETIWK